jgi:hypothetical protein
VWGRPRGGHATDRPALVTSRGPQARRTRVTTTCLRNLTRGRDLHSRWGVNVEHGFSHLRACAPKELVDRVPSPRSLGRPFPARIEELVRQPVEGSRRHAGSLLYPFPVAPGDEGVTERATVRVLQGGSREAGVPWPRPRSP